MNQLPAPDLPTRFPCWCKAIYSWGGEEKRDLGFIEGDLIECLNAGDGSWWMGRLRRDRRVCGMFPSNFVVVLDEDFRPASRASSLIQSRSPSPNPFNPQPSQKKEKPFRKPFQAYAAPDPRAQKRAELRQQESVSVPRTPSPAPRNRNTRHSSPRFSGYGGSRAPSPNPYATRVGAPSPEFPPSHAESPTGIFSDDVEPGSPPPPPPPHRTNFRAQTSTGFHEHRGQYSDEFHRPQSLTPDRHTPERTGHTPSPLTHAMNDVISSLEDMGNSALSQHEIPTQHNLDPWSPEAFDQAYMATPTKLNTPIRPNTSIGIDHEFEKNRPNHRRSRTDFSEEPPQLSNYVERMESRLGRMRREETPRSDDDNEGVIPEVPPKSGFFRPKSPFGRPKSPYGRPKSPFSRPKSPFTRSTEAPMPMPPPSHPRSKSSMGDRGQPPVLRHRKSAYEVGKAIIGRTFTNKSSSTQASSGQQSTTTNGTVSTEATDRSLMSGKSAGAYSATSAGEYARKQAEKYGRARSAMGLRMDGFSRKNGSQIEFDGSRPETPFSGVTYHSSHATSQQFRAPSQAGWRSDVPEMPGLGGLVTPKAKKSGFFKRMVESAKTGAASARSSIAVGELKPNARPKSAMSNGVTAIAGGFGNSFATPRAKDAAKDMGLGSSTGIDWVQVRRDVNRSNSISRHERAERKERCQMMDFIAIDPISEFYEGTDGDAGGDGQPVAEPTNFQSTSLALVDKNARFITSLPPMTNPVSLATGFVCRPYRTDVQRLRAIFTWCAEKITWEADMEGEIDTKRVIQTRRGGTEDIAFLVMEMCQAVNIACNVIRGYLKPLGEVLETGRIPAHNHYWNSVLVENQWRIMDCSLASPSHPKRHFYSGASSDKAESWYFLARPSEICWTHVPEEIANQHLVPPVIPEILFALPVACPQFFKCRLEMVDYDTSIVRLEDLELAHIKVFVPADIECAATVEAYSLTKDQDGDLYETDQVAFLSALCQPSWTGGQKQYTIKALLPPNTSSHGILKVYAGKKGLMQNPRHIPYPIAFALPIVHQGDGCDGYDFFTRYPTPYAVRHDLYVMQPQCKRLVVDNTFVFAVRQHPCATTSQVTEEAVSEASGSNRDGGRSPIPALGSRDGIPSPLPFVRPTSALSTTNSNSASGSAPVPAFKQFKTAKLAIQSPAGKIMRLAKKEDRMGSASGAVDAPHDGTVYETIIKCGERGPWRALVLADKSARWCVFAEWHCV